MNFWNFSIKYCSIPIFAAMYAVNVTSPAQLPLVSGCRNSGAVCGIFFKTLVLTNLYWKYCHRYISKFDNNRLEAAFVRLTKFILQILELCDEFVPGDPPEYFFDR